MNSTTAQSAKTASLSLPKDMNIKLPGAGNAWLDSIRASAAKKFAENGLPTVRDEEWRYTDIRKLKRKTFSLLNAVPDVQDILAQVPDYDLNRVVLVNGFFVAASSRLKLPSGIQVRSLADVLENNADSIENLIGSTLPQDTHSFTDLNTAHCLDGVVVEVAANTKLDTPLEIIHISTADANSSSDTTPVSHQRNLIIANKSAEIDIIERFVCADENASYLTNSVTEIIAHDNAKVQHYKVQQESANAFHIGSVFASQGRDANVTNHNMAIGGALVRNDIQLQLLGSGAQGGMNGLVVGHGKQHVHNHTEVDHRVPHCTSDEYYKTVLDDASRCVFRGRIIVAQDAQKTDAEQQNNNLLLSSEAEADSKPQLEIYADDVQCSHGATVGQLDKKSLFYLQSRGINQADAQRLLTFAFVNEVLERITFQPLQAELSQRFLGELLPDTYQDVFGASV
jgi:Fe-S cluster assembly protein SufD